jgi:hypothetical protein
LRPERAKALVSERTGIPTSRLNPVLLRRDTGAAENAQEARKLEGYLGPLDQLSPVRRDACSFCNGTGKVLGSRPVEVCGPCGGHGLKLRKPRE